MVKFTLPLMVFLAAQPALALSCLRPDSVRLYEFARDSEDLYQIVLGRISTAGPINLPEAPEMGAGALAEGETNLATSTIRVTGVALTAEAFDAPFDRETTLELGCLGPWCSDPPTMTKDLLLAIRVEGEARILNPGVCSEASVLGTRGAVDRLLDCHINGHCPQQF